MQLRVRTVEGPMSPEAAVRNHSREATTQKQVSKIHIDATEAHFVTNSYRHTYEQPEMGAYIETELP